MILKTYWLGIEYFYKNDSSKIGKLKGGFVYGFVRASDVRGALDKLLPELNNNKLGLKKVEFVSPYEEEMEWETKEETDHYSQLYQEAKSTTQFVFDDFYAYENEE